MSITNKQKFSAIDNLSQMHKTMSLFCEIRFFTFSFFSVKRLAEPIEIHLLRPPIAIPLSKGIEKQPTIPIVGCSPIHMIRNAIMHPFESMSDTATLFLFSRQIAESSYQGVEMPLSSDHMSHFSKPSRLSTLAKKSTTNLQ